MAKGRVEVAQSQNELIGKANNWNPAKSAKKQLSKTGGASRPSFPEWHHCLNDNMITALQLQVHFALQSKTDC